MNPTRGRFRRVSAVIATTPAFRRLFGISFLGLLSPRYADISELPVPRLIGTDKQHSDQSRAHHSLRVAWLMSEMCKELQLSEDATDYAVAWGLVHDIATWPLSHTGEAGFSASTETTARDLRTMMITGSDRLPASLSLYSCLKGVLLDPDIIMALFDRRQSGLTEDLACVHSIIHSPLTPDTLEGMTRTAHVLRKKAPDVATFATVFERDLVDGVRLKADSRRIAVEFWKMKSEIYSGYINARRVVEFESAWSHAIEQAHAGLTIGETLELSESEVIRNSSSLVKSSVNRIQRYKTPLTYFVADRFAKQRKRRPIPLDDLSMILVKSNLY